MNGTTYRRARRGGNLPPATFRIEPVRLNGTTHWCVCRGGILAARYVSNTTCVVEWYYSIHGITQCSGDDSSPCNLTSITRVDKRHHPPTCHPDGHEMEWRDLPNQQILPYAGDSCNLGRFLHSADATVGMTYVFALIVADTNVPQFWLTPDGGKLPPLHRIHPT